MNTVNKIQKLKPILWVNFLLYNQPAAVFVVYFFYAAKKEKARTWTNVNVASLGMAVSFLCTYFGSRIY